jgi:glucosamine-6-phosphate deaminase
MNEEIRSFVVEKLKVMIFPDRRSMGKAAGRTVVTRMIDLLKKQKELYMVFASAPSQDEFLEELSQSPEIDWKRVVAFHLDEYVGLPSEAPQNFGYFLKVRLFDKVRPGKVYYINGMAKDLEAECKRYSALLKDHPLDIACVGIGENGHLAFNDPPVADFHDPLSVKVVELDPVSREQQVHDKTFPDIEGVPRKAITLTIPTVFSAGFIYCMVPAPTKAEAVRKTLEDPISTSCPATILRRHRNAILFLDKDSASFIH